MRVKQTMQEIGIAQSQSMPKALRHAFGVGAIQKNIPLNIVQKWMGHSRIATTAIYADAVGEEERVFAERMWPTTAQLRR
jgi:site-specific recombinase XerD